MIKDIQAAAHYTLVVPEESSSRRLDLFLAQQFPKYSRTFFQKLIAKNLILVNQKSTKASYPIKAADSISIEIPPARIVEHILSEEAKTHIAQLNVSIIYENPEFIIIDKPAGLIVHKPSAMSTTITLVDWLLYKFPHIASVGDEARPGIVHRLDKDTSGLMIIAKTPEAHKTLSDMFRQRTIAKTYVAVVEGHPKKTGTIELAIGRDIFQPTKISAVSQTRRAATTYFEVVEYYQKAAVVEVKPVTGRTHQIRVHLTAIGHPIIGDRLYGKESKLINRQALHATKLSFIFNHEQFSFKSDLSSDIMQLMKQLKEA